VTVNVVFNKVEEGCVWQYFRPRACDDKSSVFHLLYEFPAIEAPNPVAFEGLAELLSIGPGFQQEYRPALSPGRSEEYEFSGRGEVPVARLDDVFGEQVVVAVEVLPYDRRFDHGRLRAGPGAFKVAVVCVT